MGRAKVDGVQVLADAFNPFGNPYAEAGAYDVNDPYIKASQVSANVSSLTAPTGAFLKVFKSTTYFRRFSNFMENSSFFGKRSSLFGRRAGAILNKNSYFRIGWSWKGSKLAGHEIFRISFGSRLPSITPGWARNTWDKIRHIDF